MDDRRFDNLTDAVSRLSSAIICLQQKRDGDCVRNAVAAQDLSDLARIPCWPENAPAEKNGIFTGRPLEGMSLADMRAVEAKETPAAVAVVSLEHCLVDLVGKVEAACSATVGSPIYHALCQARAALQTAAPEAFRQLQQDHAHRDDY